MKKYFLISIIIPFLFSKNLFSQTNTSLIKNYKAAEHFISTLNEVQRKKLIYKADDEERVNWHFIPKTRNGLPLKELNDIQKKAAIELLKTSLSEQGSQKVLSIFQLETVLKEIENRKPEDDYRDPEKYYFSIFGQPDLKKNWGWRIEGHHIALNYTSSNGKIISVSPTFMGSNPGIVLEGKDKDKQVLKKETDLGFLLINSLSEDQKKIAIFSATAPVEIISGNNRKIDYKNEEGIKFKELNKEQRKIFLQLLSTYVKNYPLDFAGVLMKRIEKADLNELHFAWAGSLKPGVPNYYRIQSSAIFIEYDNTQNNANHVHTVVREPGNDFGDDILKKHYQKEH